MRGLHYALLGHPKPDGSPYANDDKTWMWLSETVAKAARWLRYVGFDQITDQRNAEPVIRDFTWPDPWAYLTVGIDVDIPDTSDIEPRLALGGFHGVQPYHLVMIGEKSSLADVLTPETDAFGADLYLPSGEMSDTLIYRIAETAVADGRPMVVLYFADCDPAGHQMILSVTRKLQAMKELLPAMPHFEAHRAALTPAQVAAYGLPSTPLKDTEGRADRWREAFGIEQTEIDALASLRPDLLRTITRDAVAPFYDYRLGRRAQQARDAWEREAQQIVDRDVGSDQLTRIRAEAERKLAAMRQEIAELNDQLRIDVGDFDLPAVPDVPEAELNGNRPAPLIDSRWDFAEQCRALIDSKAYRNGDAP